MSKTQGTKPSTAPASLRSLAPLLTGLALLGPLPALAAFEARSLDANPLDIEAWYDSSTDLTWLQDIAANAAAAGLYPDSIHTASYTAAAAWAEGLSLGGSSDWRLPSLAEAQDLQGRGLLTDSHFDGMGTNRGTLWRQDVMWTATPLTPGVSQFVLFIAGPDTGRLDAAIYDRGFQVFGVAEGDLGSPLSTISPVPEPSTYALMGLGLLGLAWRSRRRAR